MLFDEATVECITEQSNLYAVQTNPSKPLMPTCKSWKIFCCFIENVHVSCASFVTVLVKELGHPICEYFDDQGPF